MAVHILDQQQSSGGASAGFGQFAVVRYRGMGFTPTLPYLTKIGFDRNKGTQGIKIYIDTADTNSIPTNAIGSELYSFTVPNAQITGNFQIFSLRTFLPVTPGSQYCFYIAPWNTSTDTYSDDYQDASWTASNPYSGGKPIINNNGSWSVSDSGNLDMQFETYGTNVPGVPQLTNNLRPYIFGPGLAR